MENGKTVPLRKIGSSKHVEDTVLKTPSIERTEYFTFNGEQFASYREAELSKVKYEITKTLMESLGLDSSSEALTDFSLNAIVEVIIGNWKSFPKTNTLISASNTWNVLQKGEKVEDEDDDDDC